MEKINIVKIKCPHCDQEYLPGEIFIPKYLVGQPKNIERDIEGKILWYDGINPDLKEVYVCDKCNKKFEINAKIDFNVSKINASFDEEYVSNKFPKDRLILEEEI